MRRTIYVAGSSREIETAERYMRALGGRVMTVVHTAGLTVGDVVQLVHGAPWSYRRAVLVALGWDIVGGCWRRAAHPRPRVWS